MPRTLEGLVFIGLERRFYFHTVCISSLLGSPQGEVVVADSTRPPCHLPSGDSDRARQAGQEFSSAPLPTLHHSTSSRTSSVLAKEADDNVASTASQK